MGCGCRCQLPKAPIWVKVPVKVPGDKVSEEALPVQLPYDIMCHLIQKCNLDLEKTLVDGYWKHLQNVGDSWAWSTQRFREIHGNCNCWPLGFYGDEAVLSIQNNPGNKILGLTLNCPLFRPRSTRLSRYLLFSVESDKIVSIKATLYPVLQVLVDSFNRLTEEGISGTYFLVSEIRGDQVFFRQIFRHRSWWRSKDMCFRCRATAVPGLLNYCIYESNSGWAHTLRSTDDFIKEELPDDTPCFLPQTWFSSV